MKIIVSTKVFARTIKKAIELRCESFEFNSETLDIVFNEKPYIYMKCHILEKTNFGKEKYTFNVFQMFRVLSFLNNLVEQPIVVEFNQYQDMMLSIELSQFVKSF